MAKVDRLLNIVAALQAASVPLTAEELRERVPGYEGQTDDTFRRTFERDKDDLREVGVPIETVSVEHFEQPRSAYRIRRDRYELPDPGLTPEELAALHLAATAVRLEGIGEDEVADALRKLGGMEGSGSTATVGAVQAPAQLPDLFGAVLEHHRIAFGYGAAGVVRHLEPHRLQYERGRWYVSGLDTDRDGLRSFRVDRFHGAVEVDLESSFAPPGDLPDVRLRPWEFGTSEPVAARLLLDGPIARAVLAEDPGLEVVAERDDGSVEVRLQVRNPAGLRGFVLSFLERAELLDPPELRADLVSWLESVRAAGSGTGR